MDDTSRVHSLFLFARRNERQVRSPLSYKSWRVGFFSRCPNQNCPARKLQSSAVALKFNNYYIYFLRHNPQSEKNGTKCSSRCGFNASPRFYNNIIRVIYLNPKPIHVTRCIKQGLCHRNSLLHRYFLKL